MNTKIKFCLKSNQVGVPPVSDQSLSGLRNKLGSIVVAWIMSGMCLYFENSFTQLHS